ncbi:hypothetical protein CLV91_1886 [Maribacter vaceletii]|uniref:LVIVD repeat-containing protein n=1 Tax=Maribacter vaceletii TaxID=1206816 RepID=A0A495E921_9FLAO|nr:hypothetical protein [Maribacter vaceletii]RKR13171.1 hypothetical protein CLV91_1886 [Maribacter vaceletii]
MKKTPFYVVAFLGLMTSCVDETTVFSETQDDITIEASEQALENSIVYDNAGVLDIFEEASTSGKSGLTSKDEEIAGDYPLTLVAQVDAPSFKGGENLTASHVHVDGDYAYVSYNTVEDGYAGAMDIINVSDPNNPRVTSRLYYSNADINSIQYNNGYVYFAGGVDAELSVRATSNSFLGKIAASSGRFAGTTNIEYVFQEGYNATDVVVEGNNVYVTSGQEGTLSIYNKSTLNSINESEFLDLRSVAVQDNNVAVLDASKGVAVLDLNLNIVKEIAIDSDFGINTKRTLDFSGDNIVVAEGAKGAGVYSIATGALKEYIPILINPNGVDSGDVVTNSVATNEGVLLMANGGAGLCLSEEQNDNTDLVGIIQLEGSVNYVATKGDYVFAASGKEGLQIIKLNKPDESLANRCSQLSLFSGSANLNVNSNQTLEYRGSKRFNSLNVNGSLLLCGSWTVKNEVGVNSNALFEMNGTFVVGRNNSRKNIVVNSGATMRVEGNLIIYGDLILNDGATIEFIGEDSVVNIFGDVKKSGNVSVEGKFKDVRNKF